MNELNFETAKEHIANLNYLMSLMRTEANRLEQDCGIHVIEASPILCNNLQLACGLEELADVFGENIVMDNRIGYFMHNGMKILQIAAEQPQYVFEKAKLCEVE